MEVIGTPEFNDLEGSQYFCHYTVVYMGLIRIHEVHDMTWRTTWYKPMSVSNQVYWCVSSVFPFLLKKIIKKCQEIIYFCIALWELYNDHFLYDSLPLLHNVALRQQKNIPNVPKWARKWCEIIFIMCHQNSCSRGLKILFWMFIVIILAGFIKSL